MTYGYHEHHVVYQQEVRRRGGSLNDPRNLLRLKIGAHAEHHTRSQPIKLRDLSDENIEYAFELLGPYAYDYLKRRYSGHDERLELELANGT